MYTFNINADLLKPFPCRVACLRGTIVWWIQLVGLKTLELIRGVNEN